MCGRWECPQRGTEGTYVPRLVRVCGRWECPQRGTEGTCSKTCKEVWQAGVSSEGY